MSAKTKEAGLKVPADSAEQVTEDVATEEEATEEQAAEAPKSISLEEAAKQAAPQAAAPQATAVTPLEPIMFQDLSGCTIGNVAYGDFHHILNDELQDVANSLYEMAACESNAEARKVCVPANHAPYIKGIDAAHRGALAQAIETRRMAVDPSWWDSAVNFISEHKVAIVVGGGVIAAAAGGYMAYDYFSDDGDDVVEVEDGADSVDVNLRVHNVA